MSDYILKRNRRSHHLRIRLDDAGQVIVTAPPHIPKFIINRFVNKSKTWITRQKKLVKLKQSAYPTLNWNQKLISFKGKLYYFKFNPSGSKKVNVGHAYIYISPVTGQEKDLKKTLLIWLKREGERYITMSLESWSKKMDLKYQQVRFRQQKSRWGSCSSRGNLNFNWRLIHFKPEVIDYVCIHELAHIKHPNHSTAFWQFVRRYDPTYKNKVKFLKHQSIVVEK